MSIQNEGQEMYQRPQRAGGGPELVGQMQGNLESDAAVRQRQAQQAEIDRVEKIVARDMAGAYSARQAQEALHQQATSTQPGRLGFQGPSGFIAYPGKAECGDDFETWAEKMWRAQEAERERSAGVTLRARQQHEAVMAQVRERQPRYVPPEHIAAFVSEQMGAYAAKQAQDGPSSPMLGGVAGSAHGHGVALQRGAPGKMFSRSDILAILRAQHALAIREPATAEWKAAKNNAFQDLLAIFEEME